MREKRRAWKRVAIALMLLGAGVLGATDAVPGGARIAELLGITEAGAQTDTCPNTDCKGSADCEFLEGFTCSLRPGQCSVGTA